MTLRSEGYAGAARRRSGVSPARMLCAAALAAALTGIQATAQTPPDAPSIGAAAPDKDERLPQTSAESDGVKLRMQPATESAVPIQDLGDRLVTTGSTAPVIKDGPPDEQSLPAQTEPPSAAEATPENTSPDAGRGNDAHPETADPRAPAPPAEPASGRPGRINASVKLRAEPDNAAEVVATFEANAAVTVLSCDYWCEVEAGGKHGFVFRKFVEADPSSDDRPAEKHETEQENE